MSIDLSKYDSKQLDELMNAAAEQKKRLQRARINDVRRALTAQAKAEGYTIEELFGTARARGGSTRKVAPKYRNPSNPEQTWSGRGKRPRWMEAALAGGKSMESMKI